MRYVKGIALTMARTVWKPLMMKQTGKGRLTRSSRSKGWEGFDYDVLRD